MNARMVLFAMALGACGGDDGGGGSELISTPRCVDSIDVTWRYDYSTAFVTLRANEFTIDSNGEIHTPPTTGVELHSSPPSGTLPDATTLEMIWQEGAAIIKLNAYFATDGTDWWVREMKHKDEQIIAGDDWVPYNRELFRCPAGKAYVGDVKFDADAGIPGSVTFEDLFVRAF